jgi:preprotein translocase subunit Sec63
MKTYFLKGLAEGVAGVSQVEANSVEEVFQKIPRLGLVKDKLQISNEVLIGVTPCDG